MEANHRADRNVHPHRPVCRLKQRINELSGNPRLIVEDLSIKQWVRASADTLTNSSKWMLLGLPAAVTLLPGHRTL